MLPLLQTAALNGRLRRRVLRQKLKIRDLRKQTAAALGVEVPEVTQLTRVTWKNVAMLGGVVFAVYTIIGGLADVGFATVGRPCSTPAGVWSCWVSSSPQRPT